MNAYPSLPYSHNGLKVFESVARLMSFTLAADELNVTQSAVSRQVKQLEDDLNASLIIRKHRSIELTLQGLQLFQALRENFSKLESLIASWQAPEHKRIVIKATLSYATRILISKVQDLNKLYPDYEIVIIPCIEEDESLNTPDYDLLIFHTKLRDHYENKPNMFFLREEFMAPVCAASSVTESTTIDTILKMPRLHPTLDHHDWKMWTSQIDYKETTPARNTTFFTLDLALSACLSGQGVTVTDLLLIQQELEREFFYCPENASVQYSAWRYYGHQRTQSQVIDDIIEWLKEETAQELQRLRQMARKHNWGGVLRDS
ncbi:LysR family transcriptional regulator [Vibrio paucivorans]|uniref:LysR family transcriptional regulator n=1 Tax=Vibrio paucivorans TaxID=2829489 RepID=A0A9X3CHA6_9VIBR|nr:LysR family transcriptional regulator [Vibrio paucivorans]MCW8335761.1 LysR family transcriptional regulator [Vibrio paucivorans]